MDNRRPVVVDLFAGAGGLSLGFEQAGFDVAASVEYDPIHAAAHAYNFPYCATLCADVRHLSGDAIREAAGLEDCDIDAVIGGPPCQGFSLMGRRALDDPRNELVAEFARIVVELNPKYFVMENVAGLTVGDHRRLLEEVVDIVWRHGYRTTTPFRVLQAADFGVPQSRRRVFLLGSREDVSSLGYPTPTTVPRSIRGQEGFAGHRLPLAPSVASALADLPNAEEYEVLLSTDVVHGARYGKPSTYAATLRSHGAPDSYAHVRPIDERLLTSSWRTEHTQKSISRFEATSPGEVERVSRFLRLHPDGICNTLRAGTASDRGAFTSPRPIHPVFPRCITVREAARLHGYPDWFRFHSTKWHGFRQIGNSVPPPLARAVACQLIQALEVEPTHGREVGLGSDQLLYMTQSSAAEFFGIDPGVIPQRNRKNVA